MCGGRKVRRLTTKSPSNNSKTDGRGHMRTSVTCVLHVSICCDEPLIDFHYLNCG